MSFRIMRLIGRTHSDLPPFIFSMDNMVAPEEELCTETIVCSVSDKDILSIDSGTQNVPLRDVVLKHQEENVT